jgi:hypothetical protein
MEQQLCRAAKFAEGRNMSKNAKLLLPQAIVFRTQCVQLDGR